MASLLQRLDFLRRAVTGDPVDRQDPEQQPGLAVDPTSTPILPPSIGLPFGCVLATDLDYDTLPDWLTVATAYRFGARRRDYAWQTFMRAALDHSELPILQRTVMRVLVDYHNAGTLTIDPRLRDVASRLPASRQKTTSAVSDLVERRWLFRRHVDGEPSILMLTVPCEKPCARPMGGVTVGDRGCHPRRHHWGSGVHRGTRVASSSTRPRVGVCTK